MFERILNMLKKEFIQLFRDPKMRPIVLIMPVVQLLIFGYAATTDVRHTRLAVFDLDNTVASRALVAAFVQSKYFDLQSYIYDDHQAVDVIDRSKALAVLRIDKGFAEDLQSGRTASVQLVADGTDSNTAGIVLGYASQIISSYSQNVLLERFFRTSGVTFEPPFELRTRAWFNVNLESRNFYIPGVIAQLLLIGTLMLTSMAVVREKEIGTMDQIIVTPIKPVEFIIGKSVPFVLIGYLNAAIVSVVGVFWFDVPLVGSITLLVLASGLYLTTAIGLGLLISTLANNQQQALMTAFFFNLPIILLSGFMFPIANMPPVVQWLTYLNPMRYYLVMIRGIFLKGVGFDILWPQMVALLILGILTLGLAVKRFHKTTA